MKLKPNYPCTCGHAASFHEVLLDQKMVPMPSFFDDSTIQYPITVVKGYQACNWDKNKATPAYDKDGWTGVGFDYTNFGRYCHCQEFKLDNLKFLEQEANGH